MFPLWAMLLLTPSSVWSSKVKAQASESEPTLNPLHNRYPSPVANETSDPLEQDVNDSLPAAIAEAYAENPGLAADRSDLRAADDEIGIAMAEARPTVQMQVSSGYDLVLPGNITQAARPLSERLNNPKIERNELTSQLIIDQPLWTGGRASSALRSASAAALAARASLRGNESDMLLGLIAAYADVRRDSRSLIIRRRNVTDLAVTLDEIVARREAGELTRTDIAQAEVQLQAAKVQLANAQAQLQASRASFAAIVGREPGNLAPEPELANLPEDFDEALAIAEIASPELAAAVARYRASQAQIGQAKAQGRPQLYLRATAGTSGPVVPFDRADHDVTFTGRATLAIPIGAGGRIASQIAQAQNRNAADELRIEQTRRNLVEALVQAWNQWASAERNRTALALQLRAARILHEGTLAEYREGLRSTFDVLYAQNGVRDAELGLLASQRDSYVARAAVLRRIGRLEVSQLLKDPVIHDPDRYAASVRRRGAVPWGGLVRSLDRIGAPGPGRPATVTLDQAAPEPAPAAAKAAPDLTTKVSANPVQTPKGASSLAAPAERKP